MTETPKFLRWGDIRVLPENELAVSACRWVKWAANGGGRPPFTVLFLHGGPGTGKTLLVQTLAKSTRDPVVISGVDFSRNESELNFVSAEVLIVEDVHRMPAVAVERLVTVLDDRSARRRITVVTATESPFDLRALPKRLTSRLGGGLTVAIRPPSVESRLAVATAHAKRRHRLLRPHELAALSERSGPSLRELLGAVDELALDRKRARRARPVATPRAGPAKPAPTRVTYRPRVWTGETDHPFHDLLHHVAATYRVPASELRGPGQLKTIVTARQTFAYLARSVLKSSLPELTRFLNRSPSSFANVVNDLKWKMIRDPALHAVVTKLESDWRAKTRKLVAPVSTEADGPARDHGGE